VPPTATTKSHGEVRDLFKTCVLGVNYGMGVVSLARRIKRPLAHARELLGYHKQVYRRFWRWAEQVQDQAMLTGRLRAAFGWQVNVGVNSNWRSLRNFPCQANGSEMLRLALSLAVERGVRVVAPVHDAMLIEAPCKSIGDAVRETRRAMREAGEVVLDGFRLRTDAKVVRHPNRYRDKRGKGFWGALLKVLAKVEASPRTPCFLLLFLSVFSIYLTTIIMTPVRGLPHPVPPPLGFTESLNLYTLAPNVPNVILCHRSGGKYLFSAYPPCPLFPVHPGVQVKGVLTRLADPNRGRLE
jgi:hypothetical protein